MATTLSRPVTRLVTTQRGDLLNVTLAPEGIVVREYGRRKALPAIPYGVAFLTAARIAAEALRREKAERRKARKGAAR